MNGDFELNKLGWYTPQNVVPNDFLNEKLESDQYGLFYTVKFEGNAETALWQAKSAPVEGERVYGHLEKAKSGKSIRFKRAKKEDTPEQSADTSVGQSATVPQVTKQPDQYWEDKNAKIQAQWALGRSYEKHGATTQAITEAQWLFKNIETVIGAELVDPNIGSSESTDPKVQQTSTMTSRTTSDTAISGYEKAKAAHQTIKAKLPKPEDEDAEAQSLYASIAGAELE